MNFTREDIIPAACIILFLLLAIFLYILTRKRISKCPLIVRAKKYHSDTLSKLVLGDPLHTKIELAKNIDKYAQRLDKEINRLDEKKAKSSALFIVILYNRFINYTIC